VFLLRAAARAASVSVLRSQRLPWRVLPERRLLPEALRPGQIAAQETRCWARPKTVMSTPHSAISTRAVLTLTPGIVQSSSTSSAWGWVAAAREQQTRSFGTTIGQLETLADWLEGLGVTLVGMEATGVYWKPVFWVLERRFECWLLNAQHLHNVPGRKSDVIDSAWCCQLLEHGLVRPSFVPPPEIRRLRDLTRLCVAQTEERTRAIQRLEKVLQDTGIKLSSVASSTYSASARAMLEALLAGVSDPAELAELAKARLRAKIPRLHEALANRFELAHHGVLVAGLLAHIDSLDQTVATLDARIAADSFRYQVAARSLRRCRGAHQAPRSAQRRRPSGTSFPDDKTRRIGGASSYDSKVRARGSSQRLRRPPRHTYQRAHSTKEMPASTDPAPAFSPRHGGDRAATATYHGGSQASRAYMRDHSRHNFSCKSG
jgi:Transposase